MKFATVLREAGFSTEEFKNCSELPIVLYDRKDRVISDEDVHYVENLFHRHPVSYECFSAFLNILEKTTVIGSVKVKIDEISVVVYYKTASGSYTRSFPRKKSSMDPMDFMD